MNGKKSLNVYTAFTSSLEPDTKFIHFVQYNLNDSTSTISCFETVGSGSGAWLVDDVPGTIGQPQTWIESLNLQETSLSDSDKTDLNSKFDSGTDQEVLDWIQSNYLTSGSDCKELISEYLLSGSATNIQGQSLKKVL